MGFLLRARDKFGGVVAFDGLTTIVNDPHLAVAALSDHERFAIRSNFLNQRLDGAAATATTTRRRHLNPGLRPRAAAAAEPAVSRNVGSALSTEPHRADEPVTVDVLPLLEDALSTATAEYYFGSADAQLQQLVRALLNELSLIFGNAMSLPAWAPTSRHFRIKRLHRELRQRIAASLYASPPSGAHTSYADLVASACSQAGETEGATIDLLIGSLLAAQRVPAAAAAWTLLAIARNEALQTALRVEASADRGAGSEGRRTQAGSLLDRTLLESLRLYPPTWMLQRTVTRSTQLGRYRLPAGHQVLISPYVIQRDPAVYDDPVSFETDRWLQPVAHAFMPFGHGVRACPGTNLAMVMLRATVRTVLQRWRILAVGEPPTPDPRSTLTPRRAMLRVTRMDAASSVGSTSVRGFP